MKTEQEVKEAITTGIKNNPAQFFGMMSDEVLTKEQIQDLAVIIGKALGVIE